MANARLCYVNRTTVTGVTITASSELSNRPASYLRSVARWKKWRSTTTTGNQNVDFDFGSAKNITAVILVDWKGHAGGTIKAEYWTGAAWAAFDGGTGLYTLPAFNPTKVIALWFTAGRSTQKIRILFTNTGAVSDYVELGVVFAGDSISPAHTIGHEWTIQTEDPSLIVKAVDGQEEAQTRTQYVIVNGQFFAETEADRDTTWELFRTVGKAIPFVLAVDPDKDKAMFYGKFIDFAFNKVTVGRWSWPFSFKEDR